MRRARFKETEIVRVLKEVEGGRQVKEVCREYGISDATYYNWKAKYGGMEISDIRKLKELADENRRLKQMYADLSLKHEALKDIVEKKALKPAAKRELVDYAQQAHGISQRAACEIVNLSRSVYRYQPDTNRDRPIIAAIQAVLEIHPSYGFGKLFKTLRRQGHRWNHKRVYRVYCLLKLNKRRKGKRGLPSRNPEPLAVPPTANCCWSVDFMSDALMCGRRFRTFNVVDDFNREALAIEIDLSLPAPRVIRVLERVSLLRGYPEKLRVDNGPEFISLALADWAEENDVALDFIQPGKPTQNSYIERFNRTYRDELLDLYLFRSLSEVRQMTDDWRVRYNTERPHDSLNDMTPAEYLQANNQPGNSNLAWN